MGSDRNVQLSVCTDCYAQSSARSDGPDDHHADSPVLTHDGGGLRRSVNHLSALTAHESEVTADKHGKLKVIWENARQ